MKVSISPATLKRLAALERGRSAARTLGRWPVILDPDTWEREAMAHQDKLCADTRGDEPVVTTEALRDPADVTHRYAPPGENAPRRRGQTAAERAFWDRQALT